MNNSYIGARQPAGVMILGGGACHAQMRKRFAALGLAQYLQTVPGPADDACLFQLQPEWVQQWMPELDTTGLCAQLQLDTECNPSDLEREILLTLLVNPLLFEYPTYEDFASAVRVRMGIVKAARKTALAFDTSSAAERPEDCWTYSRDTGFVILPGKSLIDSLTKASQPEVSGRLYAFSCYRATEYVLLLAVAEELAHSNPQQLARLEKQWQTNAIASGRFHDTFLIEYGSVEQPLPPKYYVPGDRVWFRNPDEPSSDASGFEGSWVFYLGNGLFSNFWKRDAPFTLRSKCLEVYHWRHGTYPDADGDLCMNEDIVAERVKQTLQNPAECEAIVTRMMRLREPKGVYQNGGCIDTSRECVRPLGPSAAPLVLPDA